MTGFCPPGFDFLSDVRDEVGADQLHADLIKEVRIAFVWDRYNGKSPLQRVPANSWLLVGAEHWLAEGKARPYHLATRTVTLLVQKSSETSPAENIKKPNRGGRPPSGDWEAIEDALAARIQRDGQPDSLNIPGWQTRADVGKWVADLLSREGADVSESTIKRNVARMLDRVVQNHTR